MALPASSTFTGVNGTDLNSLSDWDGATGGASGNGMEIQSNAAQGITDTRTQASSWTTDSFDNDHYSEATVSAITSGTYIGVSARTGGTDGSSNLSCYAWYSDSADGSYIDEYSGGTYQASSSAGSTFSATDVVRVEASGTSITGKIGGTTEITYTDSTLTTGAAGVASYSNGASRVDDWEGGDLGAAGYTIVAAQGSFTLTGQAAGLAVARTIGATQGSYTLTGQAAGTLRGYPLVAAQGTFTLTGQDTGLTVQRTISGAQGSYTLSGQTTGLYRGYSLTAAQGSYTLGGQAMGLTVQRTIAAAQGSYTLSGQATGLVAARSLTAAQGGYTLTGQDAALRFGYALTAAQGSFTLSGQATALTVARILTAAQGSYTLTGQDVTLTYTPLGGYTIVAASGSYTLTGQTTGLTVARLLAAAQGSYTLTGQDAGTYRGYLLTAGQGSYTLTGQASTLLVAWLLAAAQGTYTLTGQAATLNYAGAFTGVATGLFLTLPALRVRGRNFETVPYLLDEGGAILTDESGAPLISQAQVSRLIVQPPTLRAKERR